MKKIDNFDWLELPDCIHLDEECKCKIRNYSDCQPSKCKNMKTREKIKQTKRKSKPQNCDFDHGESLHG